MKNLIDRELAFRLRITEYRLNSEDHTWYPEILTWKISFVVSKIPEVVQNCFMWQ